MCGRFALGLSRKNLAKAYGCPFPEEAGERWKVAPPQLSPVAVHGHESGLSRARTKRTRSPCCASEERRDNGNGAGHNAPPLYRLKEREAWPEPSSAC